MPMTVHHQHHPHIDRIPHHYELSKETTYKRQYKEKYWLVAGIWYYTALPHKINDYPISRKSEAQQYINGKMIYTWQLVCCLQNITALIGLWTTEGTLHPRPLLYCYNNKKPSCRWGTARRAVSWNLAKCCTNVRRIALKKACTGGMTLGNDLQGYSRSLTLVPFDRPYMISY